jgi:integrase
MTKRHRHQYGSLKRESRKKGPDVWTFRWYETQTDGRRTRRKEVLGTVEELPTLSRAEAAADALLADINKFARQPFVPEMSFEALAAHYIEYELPDDPGEPKKAYSTSVTYKRYLRKWITPRWRSYSIRDMQPIEVEEWLHRLNAANGTKAKIRNIMSAVFTHAIKYGFLRTVNPMKSVKQSDSIEAEQIVLQIHELNALLRELKDPCYTMAFLDAATGLRISELLALQWQDVDFGRLHIKVRRAIVYGVVGECKSKASKRTLPIDAALAELLLRWRHLSLYSGETDWIFASPYANGAKPYVPGMLIRRHLKPAALRAGITERIGWHTFRRTLATLLVENGNNVKVVQELLGHAQSKVTLDTYAQAVTTAKREGHSSIVQALAPALRVEAGLNGPF